MENGDIGGGKRSNYETDPFSKIFNGDKRLAFNETLRFNDKIVFTRRIL